MTLVVKKMLANTIKELMNEKPLTKITVQDLTKKCGISRQTFYNHFHDIYELVEWIYLNEAHITLGENISYENWQDALEALFQYIWMTIATLSLTRIVLSARKMSSDSCNGKWSVS